MNITAIINSFNSDNSNIANVKKQHRQIMTVITDRIFRFEPMIENLIVSNYTFFTVNAFIRINSFTEINSIVMQHL